MSKETLLIVEDARNIRELLKYTFTQEGYRVLTAERGDEAIERAKKDLPDLILLDIMIPGVDGFEVCKTLKQHTKTQGIPIIMLTAKGEEPDKVVGLELGADDYVTKPFSPRELLARVKAVLRRGSKHASSPALRAGTIEIDVEKHIVTLKAKPVGLTSKEFRLLKILIEAKGRVLTREYLLNQVWGYEQADNIETRTIDMHIGQLRKKLKSEAERLITVKNEGYRFDND